LIHPAPLILPAALARQIESEGAAAYPNECCGIVFGKDVRENGSMQRVVERLLPVANVFEAGEQYHRFSISPKQLMDAEKVAADEGTLVLGFYHSHPDHPARPSEYDREHAWPFYSYVIVSIARRAAREMTSWVLNERSGQFDPQDMKIDHTLQQAGGTT
jgi:proteasome lid subunit RPN8/RPN11